MLHKILRAAEEKVFCTKRIYALTENWPIHHNTRLKIRKALLPPFHTLSIFLGLLAVPVLSGS